MLMNWFYFTPSSDCHFLLEDVSLQLYDQELNMANNVIKDGWLTLSNEFLHCCYVNTVICVVAEMPGVAIFNNWNFVDIYFQAFYISMGFVFPAVLLVLKHKLCLQPFKNPQGSLI